MESSSSTKQLIKKFNNFEKSQMGSYQNESFSKTHQSIESEIDVSRKWYSLMVTKGEGQVPWIKETVEKKMKKKIANKGTELKWLDELRKRNSGLSKLVFESK